MEQTWSDVLLQIVSIILTLVSSAGIPYAVFLLKNYLAKKAASEEQKVALEALNKIIDRADEILVDAVNTTKQTFVEDLKKAGAFDEAAQKEAFKRTKTAILKLLNEEAKKAVIDTFGSLDKWIETKVESTIAQSKQ